ncbi:hypothetical protein KY289_021334 [Solanum tuberosum]|nr:hypothetical protein KY289_021334 [Solanum tuberosum]
MSPYLFVLAMEYLNRSLKQLNQSPDFNYHPKCKKMELMHISFADVLLMYCRADRISIKLMLAAFEHFSDGVENTLGELSWHETHCVYPSLRGELNILNFSHWNMAAILKLLWAIAKKKEKLRVQWVNTFHIKGNSIDNVPTPKQARWVVMKIPGARSWLTTGTPCHTALDSFIDKGAFNINRAYNSFLPQLPKVAWKKLTMAK